jgi:hypothetical protein
MEKACCEEHDDPDAGYWFYHFNLSIMAASNPVEMARLMALRAKGKL